MAGIPFALTKHNKTRLASRGGQNPTSTGILVLGGQFKKKGACTSPLFRSSVVISSFPRVGLGRLPCKTQGCCPAPVLGPRKFKAHTEVAICCMSALRSSRTAQKKVSGRWGDRPLGRGMEGTVV
jgi:hypothetical protein